MKRGGRKKGSRLLPLVLVFALGAAAGIGALFAWKRVAPGAESGPPVTVSTPPVRRSAPPGRSTPNPAAPTPVRLPPDFEPGSAGHGVLAVVLDDVGFDGPALRRLEAVEGPLALAIIPGTPRAVEAAELARRKEWDVLVHLPMEGGDASQERETIGPESDDRTILDRVNRAIDRVPGAIGLNNHQGSRATPDPRVMRLVLSVVKDRGLFFLDSRTSAASVGEKQARSLGVSTISRDVFLDDAATEAASPAGATGALSEAWERALGLVGKKGHCVVIGHPRPSTLDFLLPKLAELARTKVKRVRVSELVD